MRGGVAAGVAEVQGRIEDGDPHGARTGGALGEQRLADEVPDPRGVQVGVEDGAAVAHQPPQVERQPAYRAVVHAHGREMAEVDEGEGLQLLG